MQNNANPNADRMGQAAAGQYMGNKIGLLTSLNETQKKQVGNANTEFGQSDSKLNNNNGESGEEIVDLRPIKEAHQVNINQYKANLENANTEEERKLIMDNFSKQLKKYLSL